MISKIKQLNGSFEIWGTTPNTWEPYKIESQNQTYQDFVKINQRRTTLKLRSAENKANPNEQKWTIKNPTKKS